MQYLDAISKTTEWSLFISKANHSTSNPSLCLNHQCRRSWRWTVLQTPPRPSSTNTKKGCHFVTRDYKNMNSRDTWVNRQVWPWSTKPNRVKANRVLSREHTGHNKHPLPVTQEMTLHMDITKWSISKPDWRQRSSIQSAKTRPGADCGSDHELLIAKFRLKLKKVWKTMRPLRQDLNQTPYDYTVEVMNRFKGLDLVDRVPEELWRRVHDTV